MLFKYSLRLYYGNFNILINLQSVSLSHTRVACENWIKCEIPFFFLQNIKTKKLLITQNNSKKKNDLLALNKYRSLAILNCKHSTIINKITKSKR